MIGAIMASDWMSVSISGRTILLAILAWYILLRVLENKGVLDKWNASRALGVILMVRTQKGLGLLEKLARPRKFWRAYGEVSLWVCYLAMFLTGFVVILAFIAAATTEPLEDPPPASELLAIPGLNPMIPLGWGAIAFIFSLVIHELGHGLQARGHGMRIRSFGLLQLGPLPLGAFAEPEGEELFDAPRKERLRMFAAGPATNLFAALIFMLLISAAATQITSVHQSVHVQGIVDGAGAQEAGMLPWDSILEMEGQVIPDYQTFDEVISLSAPGDEVEILVEHQDGTQELLVATLSDKREYYKANNWTDAQLDAYEIYEGEPFLGVSGISEATAGIDRLTGPFSANVEASIGQRLLSLPIHLVSIMIIPFELQGVAIHPFQESLLTASDGFVGSILGTNGILFFVNLFFWIAWVNVLLGFTNLVPMVPFDGGHMFKDIVHNSLTRLKKITKKIKFVRIHPLWIDHISRRTSSLSSLAILFMLVFTIAIPYIL